jgi:hypothetical protein
MAKYGEFYYGSGETYGVVPRESFSVEPFIADAVWYDKVVLSWSTPQPAAGDNYIGFRIVRSQFAYPETADDGIILLDWPSEVTSTNPAGIETFQDTVNLSRGKFAFYRIWLKRQSDSKWIVAGEAETLVPRENASILAPSYIDNDGVKKDINQVVSTTHDKLMGYLPKIFTTGTKATDVYDPNSTLSRFLEGFSFTIDEFLTYTQLIVPGTSGTYTNAGILKLQSQQFGLSLDTEGLTKTQKKLVRNAVYLYSRKGTVLGIKGFAESVTGYPTTVSSTSNLLLSLQDATFYKGIGNWKGVNLVTLSAVTTVTPPTAVDNDLILDSSWTAAVFTQGSQFGSIKLGEDDPIRTGIPVVAGTTYYLNFWIKSSSLTVGISSMDINWFDEKGKQIADPHTTATASVSSSWAKKSYNRTAPTGARFASINITFANQSATYDIDRVQFYASNISTYSEPRAAFIELNPTKYNYVKNPTFESDGADWDVNNATESSVSSTLDLAPSGSSMLRLVTTGASTISSPYLSFSSIEGLFDVAQSYTFSIYIKSSAARDLTLNFYATDSTSGGPGTLESLEQISVGTGWARYSVSLYLTTAFTKANTNFFVKIYGGSATAATIEFDCAQIEQGIVPTDYFDGSLISLGAGWTTGIDNQNNSTSFIYPNRDAKVSRLSSEIADFIPINTGYFVKSLLALETSGITT